MVKQKKYILIWFFFLIPKNNNGLHKETKESFQNPSFRFMRRRICL